MVAASPRRADLEATLASGGYACVVDGPEAAMAVANVVAPEHLELLFEGAEDLLPQVRAAGAVFCGPTGRRPAWATTWPGPTTSCRPTGRPASPRPCGPTTSDATSTPWRRHAGRPCATLGPHVVVLATTEGLPAHAERSIRPAPVSRRSSRCGPTSSLSPVTTRPRRRRPSDSTPTSRRSLRPRPGATTSAARSSGSTSNRLPGPGGDRPAGGAWPSCTASSPERDLLRQRLGRGAPVPAAGRSAGGSGRRVAGRLRAHLRPALPHRPAHPAPRWWPGLGPRRSPSARRSWTACWRPTRSNT